MCHSRKNFETSHLELITLIRTQVKKTRTTPPTLIFTPGGFQTHWNPLDSIRFLVSSVFRLWGGPQDAYTPIFFVVDTRNFFHACRGPRVRVWVRVYVRVRNIVDRNKRGWISWTEQAWKKIRTPPWPSVAAFTAHASTDFAHRLDTILESSSNILMSVSLELFPVRLDIQKDFMKLSCDDLTTEMTFEAWIPV